MPVLHVGNIPDELYRRLQCRAARAQRSLDAEVIAILDRALDQEADEVAEIFERLAQLRARQPLPQPGEPTSLDLLHEGRAR